MRLKEWKDGIGIFDGLLALWAAALISSAPARSEEVTIGRLKARILPASAKSGTTVIPKLTLKPGPFPISLADSTDPESMTVATLEGTFLNPNWSLLTLPGGKNVPISEADGRFRLRVFITKPKTTLLLTAVAPTGETIHGKIALEALEWDKVQEKIRNARPASSRFRWNMGAGLTHISYIQDGIPDISSIMVSAKAGVEYWLKPHSWNIGLSGYLTPVTLASSPSGHSLSFLGINARAGYFFPGTTAGLRLGLMAGFYYATTFASSSSSTSFGYANLGGPQLYPTLTRAFASGSSATLYFKLSPVSDQLTILSLSNREIASGLSYQFPVDARQRGFSLGLDWANLVVSQAGTRASSTTLSLSAGYRW